MIYLVFKARGRRESLKEQSRSTEHRPRELIRESRENVSDEVLVRMPNYVALQRTVERERIDAGAANVDQILVHNIILAGDYILDRNGDRFMLYDSRTTEPNLPVIFIFCTEHALHRMREHRHWSGDGAFKCSSASFLQLYTINTFIGHCSLPAAYCLMANKQRITYQRIYRTLRGYLGNDFDPESLMIDFEIGARGGIKDVYPDIQIHLCLFHLGEI